MFRSIGPWEIGVLLVLILLLIGPRRVARFGTSLWFSVTGRGPKGTPGDTAPTAEGDAAAGPSGGAKTGGDEAGDDTSPPEGHP